MKNIRHYIFISLLLTVAMACKKEDDITPEAPAPNLFYPDASATDKHAQLCRDFYAETGCYLLFNDTLKHEHTGTDRYGNPLYSTELLDLTYSITSSAQWKFDFNYSTDYQHELQATEILKNDILSAIDKRYHPYAFLLVDNFITYTYMVEEGEVTGKWFGPYKSETYYIGERAILMSIDALLQNKEALKNDFLRVLLEKQLTTAVLKDFYAPGKQYYGKYNITGFIDYNDFVNQTGILASDVYTTPTYDDDGIVIITYYSADSNTADLKKFLDPLLAGKEEEFMTKYEAFPIVLNKFKMLKEIVIDLGFNIN